MTNSPLKVLVVDDSALMRMALCSVVGTGPGMTVCGQAGAGAQAIALYRTLRPDVVLMDLRLPDMTGIDATRVLKEEFEDARVVLISNLAEDEDIRAGLAAGALAYVRKSIEAEELLEILGRAGH